MKLVLWLALLVVLACSSEDSGKAPASIGVEEIEAGTGRSPGPNDTVVVHYHGTFEDGTVFDSSVQRGQPATFPLNRVIACWTYGLQQMKIGGKAKLICQPEVAYGANGRPPKIPPNSTLYFEVELLDIK